MTWRILIAESPCARSAALKSCLQAQGFEIIQSNDDETTWQMIQTQKPDLVLIQVGAPELKGEEFIRRIRADCQLAQTAILCLGGPITTDELVRWFKLGIDNYIDDSFSMPLLVAQIRAHLRRISPQNSPRLSSRIPFNRRVV